ncbi:MAG TPA: CRTAC1 family protein [Planctomycetes bacterium]|nr:CRTAC1 family protein [Planctomycetota bacterium]
MLIVAVAGIVALLERGACGQSPILLRDVTDRTGITFQHTDGGSGRRYIMETVTAGLALFDYDLDGDIDIYFLNGAPLRGTEVEKPPTNALYRNDGNFRFTDVTEEAGVGDTGYGLGVAVGDYDNDGDPDIYVNNFGPNVFYRNNGDGTFTDVTRQTGTDNGPSKVGAGACFLDMDGDGDLDLYVSSYLNFSYDDHVRNMYHGFHVYPGPAHYLPIPDTLYRNNGDGTFTDVSVPSGIAAHAGRGMGMICADYDNDGDTDIFVNNDSTPDFLFQNDGKGRFEEVGLLAGFAYDMYGDEQASMGVECGDYNNDGLLDFYKTSYQDEWASLYKNLGGGLLEDVTLPSRAGQGTLQHVTWGIGMVDFDNDGDRDIFVACGHLLDNIDEFCDVTSYRVRNLLLLNMGNGRFVNVSDQSGDGLLPKLSSRGAAFGDLDNDGDIDVVVVNSRSRPTILRNDSPNDHHWIQIQLQGTKSNRDGIGAQVTVVAGDLRQMDEVHSGRSYQSHFGTRLHFGLAARRRVDRIEVRWVGGRRDVVENVPADQVLTIVEGSTQVAAVDTVGPAGP